MINIMKDLREFTLEELKNLIAPIGKEKYRAEQIFRWLYQKRVCDIGEMSNISKALRAEMEGKYYVSRPVVSNVEHAGDGTYKFLLELEDGNAVESVLIPDKDRLTQCVSSQVGCALGCRFCLTGREGFKRNLSMAEITGQLLAAQEIIPPGKQVSNIVFMGMGEPLLNFDNVMRALSVILSDLGLGFSSRRVTISTAGVIPGLKKLFDHHPVQLAISLNATTNETRDFLMPINRKYPMKELLETLKRLKTPPRRRIAFEYVMLRDVNDSLEDARRLVRLLSSIPSKINLIPLNEAPGFDFRSPTQERIDAFRELLLRKNYTVITRKSMGREISAACGQLRGRVKNH
jgi:23S rRNA (adenine2503-C2)-methyltransferase